MEDSILKSTKKVLGLDEGYTHFDLDVLTHINTAFYTLHQMGIGPDEGFHVDDETATWSSYTLMAGSEPSIAGVRTYIYLKVRMLFDPPQTSFLIASMEKQIAEHEWRLNVSRENVLPEEVTT